MENLKDKIKRLRKQQGITQAEVAKIIGVNQSTYANIEKGETKTITMDIGLGIAKALNISFNALFEIELPKNQNEDLTKEVEKLKNEIEQLKKRLEEKDLLISTLINERTRNKYNLIEFTYNLTVLWDQEITKDLQNPDAEFIRSEDLPKLFSKHLADDFKIRIEAYKHYGIITQEDIEICQKNNFNTPKDSNFLLKQKKPTNKKKP